MMKPCHPDLSLRKQSKLIGLPLSSYYYQPVPESSLNLLLMKLIDQEYLKHPFYGVRRMTKHFEDHHQELVTSNLLMFGFLGLFFSFSAFVFINNELSKRNLTEKLLKDEYFECLKFIMEEINSSYLSYAKKRDIENDLLDMFIDAQKSERSIEEVVGDPNSFAIDIISSYGNYR